MDHIHFICVCYTETDVDLFSILNEPCISGIITVQNNSYLKPFLYILIQQILFQNVFEILYPLFHTHTHTSHFLNKNYQTV